MNCSPCWNCWKRTIGNSVRIGAGAGINGHITIGNDVSIGVWSGVVKSVESAAIVSGFLLWKLFSCKKIFSRQQCVRELLRRVKELETRNTKNRETMTYEKSENDKQRSLFFRRGITFG